MMSLNQQQPLVWKLEQFEVFFKKQIFGEQLWAAETISGSNGVLFDNGDDDGGGGVSGGVSRVIVLLYKTRSCLYNSILIRIN